MKTCAKCKQDKLPTDFNLSGRSKDGRQSYCKDCQALHYEVNKLQYIANIQQAHLIRKQEKARYVWDYLLEHPCVDCGEGDPVVLEFDHVYGEKTKEISKLVNSGTLSALIVEIAKCQVRCANCHRRKTALQFNWYSKTGLLSTVTTEGGVTMATPLVSIQASVA